MVRSKLSLTLALVIPVGMALFALAQNDGRIHLPPLVQQGQDTRNVPIKSSEQVDRERAQKAHELRQTEIRRDTEKLVQLSAELKDHIENSNPGILSIDMVKKAETIEKLARSVKERLKDER
jgi:hypothetical protein